MSDIGHRCGGKRSYANRVEAMRVIRRMWDNTRLNAYHCSYCHYWHIGNRFKTAETRTRKDRYERRTRVDHLQHWDDA